MTRRGILWAERVIVGLAALAIIVASAARPPAELGPAAMLAASGVDRILRAHNAVPSTPPSPVVAIEPRNERDEQVLCWGLARQSHEGTSLLHMTPRHRTIPGPVSSGG